MGWSGNKIDLVCAIKKNFSINHQQFSDFDSWNSGILLAVDVMGDHALVGVRMLQPNFTFQSKLSDSYA